MKKFINIVLLSCLLSTSIFANEVYKTLDPEFRVAHCKNQEPAYVLNLPAQQFNQGILGTCYACAAKGLLDSHLWEQDKKADISVIDLASRQTGVLKEQGRVEQVLDDVAKHDYEVYEDSCHQEYQEVLSLFNILAEIYSKFKGEVPNETSQLDPFDFLKQNILIKAKFAPTIKKQIVDAVCPYQHLFSDVENFANQVSTAAILSLDFTSFKKELLKVGRISTQCEKKKKIPKFNRFELSSSHMNEAIQNFTTPLRAGKKFNLSFCHEEKYGRCVASHGVLISGFQTVCCDNSPDCVHLVRLENSYGEQWTREHQGGWVIAENLLAPEMRLRDSKKATILWIEPCSGAGCKDGVVRGPMDDLDRSLMQGGPEWGGVLKVLTQTPQIKIDELRNRILNYSIKNYSKDRSIETLLLLTHEAFPNAMADHPNSNGQTLLAMALNRAQANPEFVRLLLKMGANPNLVPKDELHTLFEAYTMKDRLADDAILNLLIEHHADPNHVSPVTHLPLLVWAVKEQKLRLVEILQKGNFDSSWRDAAGRSLQDYADQTGNPKLIQLVSGKNLK